MTILFQVSKPKVSKRDFGCGYFWHVAQTHVARNSSDRFQVSKPKVSKREFLYTSKILFQVSKPKVSKRQKIHKVPFQNLSPFGSRYAPHMLRTISLPSFQTKSFQKGFSIYSKNILFQNCIFAITKKIPCRHTVFRTYILRTSKIYFLLPSFQTKSFQKAKNSQSSIPEFVSLWKQPFT